MPIEKGLLICEQGHPPTRMVFAHKESYNRVYVCPRCWAQLKTFLHAEELDEDIPTEDIPKPEQQPLFTDEIAS